MCVCVYAQRVFKKKKRGKKKTEIRNRGNTWMIGREKKKKKAQGVENKKERGGRGVILGFLST